MKSSRRMAAIVYDRIAVIPFDRSVHADAAVYDAPLHLGDAEACLGAITAT